MTITINKTWLYLIGGAVLLAALAIGGRMAMESYKASIIADVKTAMLQQQREQVQQQTADKIAAVKQERAAADTPREQVAYTSEHIRIPFAVQSQPSRDGVADPPLITFPQAQLPKLADYVATHEATLAELDGCKQQLKLCDLQVSALQAGRKTTFWNKAKWFAIGGGIGIVTGYAAHR